MSDQVAQKPEAVALREMIRQQGESVLQLPGDRLSAFLADYLAACSALARNALKTSVQLGIPRELALTGRKISLFEYNQMVARLTEEAGLQLSAAQMVIRTWLFALNREAPNTEGADRATLTHGTSPPSAQSHPPSSPRQPVTFPNLSPPPPQPSPSPSRPSSPPVIPSPILRDATFPRKLEGSRRDRQNALTLGIVFVLVGAGVLAFIINRRHAEPDQPLIVPRPQPPPVEMKPIVQEPPQPVVDVEAFLVKARGWLAKPSEDGIDAALAALREVARVQPGRCIAHAGIAYCLYRQRSLPDAQSAAEEALRLHALSADESAASLAEFVMGRIAEEASKVQEARAHYEASIALDPNQPFAANAVGTMAVYLNPSRDTIDATKKALRHEELTTEDVEKLAVSELRLVRNAPYAANGADFRDYGLNRYFYGSESEQRFELKLTMEPGSRALVSDQSDRANVELVKKWETERMASGWMGVSLEDANPSGAKIVYAAPNSAALVAGLAVGDVITKIDDTATEDTAAVTAYIREHAVGDKVTVYFLRGMLSSSRAVTLARWSPSLPEP